MFAKRKGPPLGPQPLRAFETSSKSLAVAKPSGKIMSAPASTQALARLMHSDIPNTPQESVLAQTTKLPLDIQFETLLAIEIFFAISSVFISYFPSKCPHLLGNTWSYMWRPEAPAQKYSHTVLAHISPYPNPVSASARIGRFELILTSFITFANQSRVRRPISGTPDEAVTAAPEIQSALQP